MTAGEVARPPPRLPAEFQDQVVRIVTELRGAGYIQFVLRFDGRLDPARLSRAVRLAMDAEPILGCRFVLENGVPVWRPRTDLDAAADCTPRSAADAAAVEIEVQRCLAEPYDPDADPNLRARLVRGPSGDVLVVKVSHIVADGTAALDALYALAELYARLGDALDHRPHPNPASRDSFLWMRSFKLRDRLATLVHGLRDAAARAGGRRLGLTGDPQTLLDPARSRGPQFLFERLAEVRTAALAQAARDRRCTVNDLVLAAFLRAYHRLLGAPPDGRIEAWMPVNMRRYAPLERRPAIRNLGGMCTVAVDAAGLDGFEAALAQVMRATKRQKSQLIGAGGQLMAPLLHRLPYGWKRAMLRAGLLKQARRPNGPGFTNVGLCRPERLDFGGVRPRTVAVVGHAAPYPIFLMMALQYAGALTLSMGCYESDLPRSEAAGFLAGVVADLDAVSGARPD